MEIAGTSVKKKWKAFEHVRKDDNIGKVSWAFSTPVIQIQRLQIRNWIKKEERLKEKAKTHSQTFSVHIDPNMENYNFEKRIFD